MATNRVSPKKGKVVDIPDAVVTIGTPTAGDTLVSVAFTASSPATGGPVQKYTAISSPGSFTGSATTSPVIVTGLTNGTAYTFTVAAGNATGNGVFSSASASATPIVPTSFESIATVNVGAGGSSTITFSSIPQTYKHLQLRCLIRNTNSANGTSIGSMQFNSDTGGNYTRHNMYGTGSTVAAGAGTGVTFVDIGVTGNNGTLSNTFSANIIDILDYTSTNKYKTVKTLSGFSQNNNGEEEVWFSSSAWLNTSAINSINFYINSYSFTQYSSFALYGIRG